MGIEPTVFRLEGERVIHCATGLTDKRFYALGRFNFGDFLRQNLVFLLRQNLRFFTAQLTNEQPYHLTMFSLGLHITPCPFDQNSVYYE